jgi:hypothetical protein
MYPRYRDTSTIPEKLLQIIGLIMIAMIRMFIHAGMGGKIVIMLVSLFITNAALSILPVTPADRVTVLCLVGLLCAFAALLGGLFGAGRE